MKPDEYLLATGIFLLVINLLAFFVVFWDKSKSRNNKTQRIPEGVIFFFSAIFGSLGVYLGMLIFHHKTQKWYFLVGIPLLIMQNCAFLWLAYNYLK